MHRIAIQRVSLWSAFKFGFILGALMNTVPAFLFALAGKWVISTLRVTLEGWQNVDVGSILGQSIRADLVTLLNLEPLLKMLRDWDALSPLVLLLIVVVIVLFGSLWWAVAASLLAGVYNVVARFSGGIRVDVADDMFGVLPEVGAAASAWLTSAAIPGGVFALTTSPTRIGREASNLLVLSSQYVAPVHAELVQVNGRWIIRDLSPNNSTFVNDRAVRENMLKEGFRIRLGDVELVFRSP